MPKLITDGTCTHENLTVHAFTEVHVYYGITDREQIKTNEMDNITGIRAEMAITCHDCPDLEVRYEDWRQAPAGLLPILSKVREDMVQFGGCTDGCLMHNEPICEINDFS